MKTIAALVAAILATLAIATLFFAVLAYTNAQPSDVDPAHLTKENFCYYHWQCSTALDWRHGHHAAIAAANGEIYGVSYPIPLRIGNAPQYPSPTSRPFAPGIRPQPNLCKNCNSSAIPNTSTQSTRAVRPPQPTPHPCTTLANNQLDQLTALDRARADGDLSNQEHSDKLYALLQTHRQASYDAGCTDAPPPTPRPTEIPSPTPIPVEPPGDVPRDETVGEGSDTEDEPVGNTPGTEDQPIDPPSEGDAPIGDTPPDDSQQPLDPSLGGDPPGDAPLGV